MYLFGFVSVVFVCSASARAYTKFMGLFGFVCTSDVSLHHFCRECCDKFNYTAGHVHFI